MDQNKKPNSIEIDLKVLIDQLWQNRFYIIKTTAVFLIIGFVVAISVPREYTCTVKMMPESDKSVISGSVSSLAALAGINISNESGEGINQLYYPDVVKSMPFLTGLMNMSLTDYEGNITLYNYIDKEIKSPWWTYVIQSPFIIIDLIKGSETVDQQSTIDYYNLSKKQDEKISDLKERIDVSIDKQTALITTSVTMQDPVLAACISDTIVNRLNRYVIEYRTNKAQQDLEYIQKLFSDARLKYFDAQSAYAQFIDRNKNVISESFQVEQERLRNEQSLAFDVYSTLAQQVEQAKMKVQEETPSVTIIEPARVPAVKSNMSRATIILTFIFCGLIGGFGYTFFRRIKISRISN